MRDRRQETMFRHRNISREVPVFLTQGKFDPDQSVSVNVAIASPLLSRFDLILVLVDSQNQDWDEVVATYILEQNPKPKKKRVRNLRLVQV